MKLKSGTTDQYIYFVAFADTGTNPGTNRMTGYASKFTVNRSRNGGAATAYTTPTINETDTGLMTGVYELLLDEDTSVAAGNFTEAYVVHINDTGGHVRPITREVELFRSDTGGIADAIWAKSSRTLTSFAFDTGIILEIDRLDTGFRSYVDPFGVDLGYLDTGQSSLTAKVEALSQKVDTGVPASIKQTDTGILQEITRLDTGLRDFMDNVDTGIHGVVASLSQKVDTGIGSAVWSESGSTYVDTGSLGYRVDNPAAASIDTGQINQAVWQADASRTISNLSAAQATRVGAMADENDTGRLDVAATATLDTGAIHSAVWQVPSGTATRTLTNLDTGNLIHLAQMVDENDTGRLDVAATATLDTGAISNAVWNSSPSSHTDTGSYGFGVNIVKIFGDTGAADNLANMYNGTGYTEETGPASRAQVNAIGASSGGSLNFAADTGNIGAALKSISFVGVEDTGSPDKTEQEDGVYHQIGDTTNAIDLVYKFDVGGSKTAVETTFKGYLNSGNDEITLQAYDFVNTVWDTLATITGQSGSTNITTTASLLARHTGTGADLGAVFIRFVTSGQSNPTLFVDQILVAAVSSNTSIGYVDGAVWLDTGVGNTNTESFVDGTADNPVSTLAAATTIANNLNLKTFNILPGSSISLGQAYDDYEFMGRNYTVAFNGQSVTNTFLQGATVSGTFAGANPIMEDCIINAITGTGGVMRRCFFNDVAITNNGESDWFMNDCRSRVAGTGSPAFDFGEATGTVNVNLRNYMGGITVNNMGDTGTHRMSMDGMGQLVLDTGCESGTLALRGIFKVTDNASGAVDLVRTDPTMDQIHQGTAQAGTANTITLAAAASSVDGIYDPGLITILTGAGAGETRAILGYDGTTKVANVGRDWRTTPNSTSSYIVRTTPAVEHVNDGLAAGGAATTITLNSAASSTDDIYVGQTIAIFGGTGQDQSRAITDYNGTTKVATVHRAWETTPSTDSSYAIFPAPGNADLLSAIDTGVKSHIDALSNKVDTGLPASIDQTDTGLRALINRTDTGLRAAIDNVDTGVHGVIAQLSTKVDTGVPASIDQTDTGLRALINILDTGVRNASVEVFAISDTGINDRLASLTTSVSSVSTAVAVLDTGVRNVTLDANLTQAKGDTGVVGHLVHAFTDTGAPKANITQVNSTTVTGTGDTGVADAWGPA